VLYLKCLSIFYFPPYDKGHDNAVCFQHFIITAPINKLPVFVEPQGLQPSLTATVVGPSS